MMRFLWKRLAAMHAENKVALAKNQCILEAATTQAGQIAQITAKSEAQAAKLTRANARNHYSESLTHAFRGTTA